MEFVTQHFRIFCPVYVNFIYLVKFGAHFVAYLKMNNQIKYCYYISNVVYFYSIIRIERKNRYKQLFKTLFHILLFAYQV